jgi:hypothetical protein
MTKVVVDETMRRLLPDLSRPLEFCDETGHVLGRFLPETAVVLGQTEPPPLSEEELQRRKAEPAYTTAEVLAYLERPQ